MIHYSLICEKQHAFEGWFRNSRAFDEQLARGQVVCPDCGSAEVAKAPMAPGIALQGGQARAGGQEEVRQLARRVRDYVEKNAEYVGERFAEEARKVHYGEVEPRGIYGKATPEETSELREEGIAFHPLPALPEDQN